MDKEKISEIWSLVEKESKLIVDKFPDFFELNLNSEYIFKDTFLRYIEDIKSKFMMEKVENLDRHKIASVIICSIIIANPINVIEKYSDGKIFDGNQKIALDIGLSYMHETLKMLLEKIDEKDKFNEYYLPEALMCDTNYITILSRNLYYAKNHFLLNPVDLANTLFLFEYITLIKCDINLTELKRVSMELTEKDLKS